MEIRGIILIPKSKNLIMLKVTNLFSVFIFSLLLIACGGDSDNELENESIQGTWVAQSLVGTVETDLNFQGEIIQTNISFEDISLDYELTFDETTFSTEGDYNIQIRAMADGEVVADTNSDVSNVSGNGKYTDSGTSITLDKPVFTLTFQGQELMVMDEEQTAAYEINSNGELVFSQNEIMTDNTAGIESTSRIVATSVWKRK